MPYDGAFADHVRELLAPLGTIRIQRMFGGAGIYCDGIFMALIAHDQLYLKVDEKNLAQFEAAGCTPFVYQSSRGSAQMRYYRAPEEALDSAIAMQAWAKSALAAALRARNK